MTSSLPYVLAIKALEKLVNEALAYDEGARQRFNALVGKRLYLETSRPQLQIFVRIETDRLFFDVDSRDTPHATIEAPSLELLRQLLTTRQLPLVGGAIAIHGNTALVQEIHDIVLHLDVDWEEPLSHWLGDITAHQIGNGVRGVMQFVRRSARIMFQNSREYLQEELGAVPMRWEVEEFLTEVDDCRADGERLEARLDRLQARLQKLESR